MNPRMKINTSLCLLFPFLLLEMMPAGAQADRELRVSADKQRILIGEPFHLTVEESRPDKIKRSFFRIDSIPHFEFSADPVTDSVRNGESVTCKTVYALTSFDSGRWVLPVYPAGWKGKTDTVSVEVVFSDFDPDQDYHDIKDILAVKPAPRKPWWWYAAGGVLLLAVVLYILRRRKKAGPVAVAPVLPDARREALEELDKLEKDNPPAKIFHSRLAAIFRLYVFRRKGILSLQKTTGELALRLKEHYPVKPDYDRLLQALRLGDSVKFARYEPVPEETREALQTIRAAILNLEKDDHAV